ncbi:MAG: class I SAM-dependent methyltransferase [Flavobacteriales bacterium]
MSKERMSAEASPSSAQVSAWYDGWVSHQRGIGINARHRRIARGARKAGYRDGMNVLEIGCGIGTVTSLLARGNRSGSILAVDISPKSVEEARRNLSGRGNVRFLVSDMSAFQVEQRFDFVVLPDVIEHIPLEQHPALFATLARHLSPDARVVINVPCAQLLEHLHLHDPSVLQVIDQPVHADVLLRNAYAAGLVLETFESYGLQYTNTEYHFIVLRSAYVLAELRKRDPWVLRWEALRAKLGFL